MDVMNRPAIAANTLLASLPEAERERLEPDLEPIDLPLKYVFYEPDAAMRYVYFPTAGVASMTRNMADGAIVEIATVGKEGLVGIPLVLGDTRMASRGIMQVPGRGLRMPAQAFAAALEASPALHRRMLRYSLALMEQMSLSAACNRAHAVEQRCARWLLQTHDRVEGDSFPLTQEFLAQMLGCRRPTVSIAAGMLQKEGVISYVRGVIRIIDRKGLERIACECYRAIAEEYRRLD